MFLILAISLGAGFIGSLVGLGGGIIIVPVLTLLFHVPIQLAIGASIVAVIATSSGAAIAYIKEHFTNLRAGMFLEIGTTLGAISGAMLITILPAKALFDLFALVLLYSVATMLTRRRTLRTITSQKSNDALADGLRLHGSYYDEALDTQVTYTISHTRLGLSLMYIAGMVSALLGVGSGSLKVPVMDIAMRMPLKASTATSDFMIGVTAAASAGAYFSRGQIDPYIASPIAIGVLIGAFIGSRLLGRASSRVIRTLFLIVLCITSVEMLRRGLGI